MSDYQYALLINGVWGRKRKVDHDAITLGDSRTLTDVTEIGRLVIAKLDSLKPKNGLKWRVVRYPAEFNRNHPDIVTIAITQGVVIQRGSYES